MHLILSLSLCSPGPTKHLCFHPLVCYQIPGTLFSGGFAPQGHSIWAFRELGTPAMVSLPTSHHHIPPPTRGQPKQLAAMMRSGRHTTALSFCPVARGPIEGGTDRWCLCSQYACAHFHFMFKRLSCQQPFSTRLLQEVVELVSSQRGGRGQATQFHPSPAVLSPRLPGHSALPGGREPGCSRLSQSWGWGRRMPGCGQGSSDGKALREDPRQQAVSSVSNISILSQQHVTTTVSL